MYRIALKMLIQDKAKYIGMILSLSFSTIIITQQMAIFIGLMRRTYAAVADTPQADIWVMNPNVKMIDDINPLRYTQLFRVKSIDGVAWAVPLYKGLIRARLPNGQFQTCNVIGIDDASLIGGPYEMLAGKITDIRQPDAIIVNKVGAEDKLAQTQPGTKEKKHLQVGDVLELNDKRAKVVGICKITRTFRSQPMVYTTFNRALSYAPFERKRLSFILVKADKNVEPKTLCKRIQEQTHLAAYTKEEFENLTINYYMKNTGIPINFGIAVLLGLLIGAAIAGQIFFNFTSDNLKYLGLFNAMGASRTLLAKVTLLQGLWVGFLGWSIGSGAASFLGFATQKTQLSFHLPWQLLIGTCLIMMCICIVSSLISIQRIFNIQLWTMFKQ